PLKAAARAWRRIRSGGRNDQVDFSTESCLTPHVEMPADDFGALAHAGQSEMSLALVFENLRIDSLAVVAHAHLQLRVVVPNFDFDVTRVRVAKRIAQRLAGDAVDVVAEDRMQRPRRALDGDVDDGRVCVAGRGLRGRELVAERADGDREVVRVNRR